MTSPALDVVGIGNAIVDVLTFAADAEVAAAGLQKGSMTLVEESTALSLYGKAGQTTECSGGSVANSLAGLASLGTSCAFIGKVKTDQLGGIFTHDMRAVGVQFDSHPMDVGPATATCLIYVTPDAQRTMATYIGACGHVSEADIDESLIASAAITYVEGYLWDLPAAKSAIRKAMRAAREAGRKVAFTLSDTFCVHRHRADFLAMLEEGLDILFCNEAEIMALYETEDFDTALSRASAQCAKKGGLIAITRSEKGSVVVTASEVVTVPTQPVAKVVDTTGAGDLYAAGFLYGMAKQWKLDACARLGNSCAGQIITQLGARSQKSLKSLVA